MTARVLADTLARESDPQPSKDAAAAAAFTWTELRRNVLVLISEHRGVIGSELNARYTDVVVLRDWCRVAWDSPRKRAGDLERAGYVRVIGTRTGESRRFESEYEITSAGLDYLRSTT